MIYHWANGKTDKRKEVEVREEKEERKTKKAAAFVCNLFRNALTAQDDADSRRVASGGGNRNTATVIPKKSQSMILKLL